jgi:hypothetical protein
VPDERLSALIVETLLAAEHYDLVGSRFHLQPSRYSNTNTHNAQDETSPQHVARLQQSLCINGARGTISVTVSSSLLL